MGVECARDLERNDARPAEGLGLQGGEGVGRSGDDDLAAAVEVGRLEVELGEPREDGVLVPADDGAQPRAGDRGGLRHRVAAGAHDAHGLVNRQDAGARGSGDLTDRMSRDAGDVCVAAVGEERMQGHDARRHDERLRDGGVADGVGVGRRAVGHEVEARRVAQLTQPQRVLGAIEPRGEEAGLLGALARADDDDHPSILPSTAGCIGVDIPQRIRDDIVSKPHAAGVTAPPGAWGGRDPTPAPWGPSSPPRRCCR